MPPQTSIEYRGRDGMNPCKQIRGAEYLTPSRSAQPKLVPWAWQSFALRSGWLGRGGGWPRVAGIPLRFPSRAADVAGWD